VGIWAVFTGGNGPAGAGGAQDENYTSAMMCMAIPLAYFSIPSAKSRLVKLYYIVALAVFVAAIVVSSSRGGFLGLLGVALFCVLYSPRRKQAFTGLLIGAALALAVAGPSYWKEMETITDTKDETADMRLELWEIAARMFAHNPLFGVGPGNFRWNAGTYQSVEQLEKFGRDLTYSILVHSTYFEILSEWGLVGAILFATILIRTFRDLRRLRLTAHGEPPNLGSTSASRQLSDTQQMRLYSLALSGCLVGYAIPAAFVSFTYFSHFWLIAALAAALNAIAKSRAQTVASDHQPARPHSNEDY
jgi:O-antigen ligase